MEMIFQGISIIWIAHHADGRRRIDLPQETGGIGVKMACLVCGKPEMKRCLVAREMMFGTREKFPYLQCDNCKSIQIEEIPFPNVLAKHYPNDYYSFTPDGGLDAHNSAIKAALLAHRDRHRMGLETWIGWVLSKYKPGPTILPILKAIGVQTDQKILDVGCGSAANLLNLMAACGFVDLLGADPFIAHDILPNNGVRIFKRYIHEIEGNFDLIMFNHSLEHVDDPRSILTEARARLKTGGKCLVRIPTTSSLAWEIYGADWVQLDAPRHLFVPSRDGIKALAEFCGFVVEQVVDDSSEFQFAASELYRKDIPLNEQKFEVYFSSAILKEFRRNADDANADHRGDQAAFILKPAF